MSIVPRIPCRCASLTLALACAVCAGAGHARENFALHRPATGSAICKPGEEAAKAVNGSNTSWTHDKFCSLVRPAWLQVDLQALRKLHGVTVRHAGASGEAKSMNTRAFVISVSCDGKRWTPVAKVEDNRDDVSEHSFAPVKARYLRLDVSRPTQGDGDPATRIYEIEAW